MFKQISPSRLYHRVVAQIEEAILAGRLQPGDKLPPERELRDVFKTSRRTLREGLRVLEKMGLIEIRTGAKGGAFVKALTADQMGQSLGLLIRHRKISLDQLAEFREGLEGIAAALAARKAGESEIARLKDILAQAEALVEEGPARYDDFLELEKRLHQTLAGMSGNLLYESVVETILNNIDTYYQVYLPKGEWDLRQNYQDWRRIVAALEDGPPDEVSSLLRAHIRRFSQFMKDHRPWPQRAGQPERST